MDWKKILIVAAVLAVVGYQWYQQNKANQPADPAVATAEGNGSSFDYDLKLDEGFGEKDNAAKPSDLKFKPDLKPDNGPNRSSQRNFDSSSVPKSNSKQLSQADDGEFLVAVGGRNLKSPAGLVYGMGGGGEHRVEHVMRHGRDDTSRPAHGVFDGDEETILKLLDEAYQMVQTKSKYAKKEASQTSDNTVYTVSMGRRVGYEGGEKGKRNGNRALKSVRLVLNGDRVITAYPYR